MSEAKVWPKGARIWQTSDGRYGSFLRCVGVPCPRRTPVHHQIEVSWDLLPVCYHHHRTWGTLV